MVLESSGTILYVAKISYQSDKWLGNCQGDENFTQTHTHKHTHTHTHTNTHRHTPRPILQVLFFCENAETRLNRKQKNVVVEWRSSVGLHQADPVQIIYLYCDKFLGNVETNQKTLGWFSQIQKKHTTEEEIMGGITYSHKFYIT